MIGTSIFIYLIIYSCIEELKNGKRLYHIKINVNILVNIRKMPYFYFREDYGAKSKDEVLKNFSFNKNLTDMVGLDMIS